MFCLLELVPIKQSFWSLAAATICFMEIIITIINFTTSFISSNMSWTANMSLGLWQAMRSKDNAETMNFFCIAVATNITYKVVHRFGANGQCNLKNFTRTAAPGLSLFLDREIFVIHLLYSFFFYVWTNRKNKNIVGLLTCATIKDQRRLF